MRRIGIRPLTRMTFAFLAFQALVAPDTPSGHTPREPYSMVILVDGVPLAPIHAKGRSYIEARPGAEYSIRLRNDTVERVAVALTVDGLNTIDAKTTGAREGSKWILGPRQTITIDGWQTSVATARRFFFTTEEASYGAWLGKTANLGVITAAVFRERRPRPAPISEQRPKVEEKTPYDSQARSAPGAPTTGRRSLESEAVDDLAATGIGREVGHDVRRVRFEAEAAVAAILELRYEYRDALIRLGVLPGQSDPCDALRRRERARGFDGMEFAPSPYEPGCP